MSRRDRAQERRRHLLCVVLLAVMVWVLVVWLPRGMAADELPPGAQIVPDGWAVVPPQFVDAASYEGHSARWWADRSRGWHQRARGERRALLAATSTVDALRLAAIVYGVSFELLFRKASCESTGTRPVRVSSATLNPSAKNRHSTAKGLGQFLDTTWASTPFAAFSPYDPVANALAMGWMHSHAVGRGGEWYASRSCWQ